MDVPGFITKAAEKSGLVRERFNELKMPTDPSNITVLPFFGDLRSTFVLSSLLLNRFRLEEKGSRYFILVSWPGMGYLFPYVDEYWSLDEQTALKVYRQASLFRNKSDLLGGYYRTLNQYFFEDVVIQQFAEYYDHGITNAFWEKYKHVKRALPSVPSAAGLTKEFTRELASRGGFKVFIYPSTHILSWNHGNVEQLPVAKSFWLELCNHLISAHYTPVVYKGFLTHDLSVDLTGKCIFFNDKDKLLTAMRATGCVLDVFSGISRIALAARCPFVCVDERAKYSALREYEIDDLCGLNLPKQYIFSFPTIIDGGYSSIISNIIARLNVFLPGLDRDNWPSTGESMEIVPYETVRIKKMKKFGTRLLKLPKE